jgi:DNA-binding MarR family transcriptional regulator
MATTAPIERIELEAMILGRHLSPIIEPTGNFLDRSAYTLLTRLELEGPMSIGQLSDAFGLDASTLNRQTAKLVKDDLVRRIPDPEGGIARKFEMTSVGQERLARDRSVKLRGVGEILEDWPAEDVALLAAMLRRFNVDIERRDGRPWPRTD